jgi:hypothetical protein
MMPEQLEQTDQALVMESTDAEFDDSLGNDAAIDQNALVKNVTDDFASMQRALIEGLFERLTKSTGRLRSEVAVKMQESAALRSRYAESKPRVEARMRVLAYEIDKAISEGLDGEVGAMRAEIVEITKNLADLLVQADGCDRRVGELSKLQKERARKIFEAGFPEIRAALVEVQRGMCNLLDGVWDDLLRYQRESGLEGSAPGSGQRYERPLLTPALRADLTARDKGPEGEVFNQLSQWFAFR